jgi:hypothetical protein
MCLLAELCSSGRKLKLHWSAFSPLPCIGSQQARLVAHARARAHARTPSHFPLHSLRGSVRQTSPLQHTLTSDMGPVDAQQCVSSPSRCNMCVTCTLQVLPRGQVCSWRRSGTAPVRASHARPLFNLFLVQGIRRQHQEAQFRGSER